MLTEIKETCYKGCRILLGNEKRVLINKMISTLRTFGFDEISIPIIQHQEIFANKVGQENNNLMFNFKDRGERDLCLAPEYTAVIQRLSQTVYKHQTNVKLFYVQECFRGENPQAGRYRQFTQLGVEILNPTDDYLNYLIRMANSLITLILSKCPSQWYNDVWTPNLKVNTDIQRGLDYYIDGEDLFIHGGFDRHRKLKEQDKRIFCWDRDLWLAAMGWEQTDKKWKFKMKDKFKRIFIGHSPTQMFGYSIPIKAVNIYNLDTGCGKDVDAPLTIMNVETEEYWQSKK